MSIPSLLARFILHSEKEDHQTVINSIERGVGFRGTNLWILVFAIFIASLGLNVNSTAVIIGAMLVSPLMGPIMGLGLGIAINDLALLRSASRNYLFSAGVGLATSTIYFILSPINEAHSEILSRTLPNIYDVLIAIFGGLAGILATTSKQKGNVIPGVAIATALMPPLCTAGYGLATLQMQFLFGALYLFFINTVFIALATVLTLRFLKYPFKHLPNRADELKAQRIVSVVVLLTLLPSIYFGYALVQENKFTSNAYEFVAHEAGLKEDYLLKTAINCDQRSITLTYGGRVIQPHEVDTLRSKLVTYNLEGVTLDVKQGFASLSDIKNNEQVKQMIAALQFLESELKVVRVQLDSLTADSTVIENRTGTRKVRSK